MGTWGPGIFSDDEAADARAAWREAVIDGADLDAATDRIVRDFRDAVPGPGQDPYAANVWIALAAAQFETGRLQDRVRDRGLAFLEHGGDLGRWEDRGAARARVLAGWAAKLRGPQPAAKRLRRPPVYAVPFAVGDVVRLRSPDTGAEGLVHVGALSEDGTVPLVEPLAWRGGALPDPDALAAFPAVVVVDEPTDTLRIHVMTPGRADAFGPHLGEVVARGVARPPLAQTKHRRWETWAGLARKLDDPRFREGLALALDPAELARRRAEYLRKDATGRVAFFARMVERFAAGERSPTARDVAAWADTIGRRYREHLAPADRAAFEAASARARELGVELGP